MNKKDRLVHFGPEVTTDSLKIERAKIFSRFFQNYVNEAYVELLSIHAHQSSDETFVFLVQPELSQSRVWDIKHIENIAVQFKVDDAAYPDVFALRKDFPRPPHTNLRSEEFPISLCLYEQPWSEVRLGWSPKNFIERIRCWLTNAANGELHHEDQPLEPLLGNSLFQLVLPSRLSDKSDGSAKLLKFRVVECESSKKVTTFSPLNNNYPEIKQGCIALTIQCEAQTHGVINRLPDNLNALNNLTKKAGMDVIEEFNSQISNLNLSSDEVSENYLVMLINFPKKRYCDSTEVTDEYWGFLFGKKTHEIADELGLRGKDPNSDKWVPIIGAPEIPEESLKNLLITPMKVFWSLSSESAAILNGSELSRSKFIAVGAGALGAQTLNNLFRSGFGQWTIIDKDMILPHNLARHSLVADCIGFSKSEAVSFYAKHLLYCDEIAESICCDILNPGAKADSIEKSICNSEMIFDFSASPAVSRFLAKDCPEKKRIASIFLNPNGSILLIFAEDLERRKPVDWLEMNLYYNIINSVNFIGDYFNDTFNLNRYSNSCNDVTSILSQDHFAIFSGIASKQIKRLSFSKNAEILAFHVDEESRVSKLSIEIDTPFEQKIKDWQFVWGNFFLTKLTIARNKSLPNETGGVIVGHWDRYRKICYIIDIIDSPPDSEEWPCSYIRGNSNLLEILETIGRKTGGHIQYVGEWHSHPENCSIKPSSLDLTAFKWLKTYMEEESLPPVMLIVGQDQFSFVDYG